MAEPASPTSAAPSAPQPEHDAHPGQTRTNTHGGMPREVRMHTMLGLQGQVGNAAVQRLITPPVPLRRSWEELIAARDISGIKGRRDFASATPSQRLSMIEILVNQSWVGPLDESAIEDIWNSFGQSVISVAQQNQALWTRCIAAGAELADIPVVRQIRDAFARDVKALAHVYMRRNRQSVLAEATRLGLGNLAAPGGAGAPGAGPAQAPAQPDRDAIVEVQQLAREAQRADDALARLRGIPVGHNWETVEMGGDLAPRTTREVAEFSPRSRPQMPAGPEDVGFARWEDVNEQYQAVLQARAAILARNPAVYAVASQGRSGALAGASPQGAATILREVLGQTLRNIDQTEPKIDSGDLDWRDLAPLHNQLYHGTPAASGTPWNQRAYRDVAEDVIGDYQSRQFWIALGLGSLAAAAFIFSEIATGGMATFLWASAGLAISATQAAVSWERYEDLATAAGAATSEETRLVGGEQVSEALLSAVLDTAFAFLDGIQAVRGVATAIRATAAREAIGRLGQLTGAEASEAIEGAVRELGPQEAIRRSGRTPEELAQIVGPTSETGRRLQQVAGDVSVRPGAPGGPGTVAGEVTPEARRLAGRVQGTFERWRTLTPRQRLEELAREANAGLVGTGMPPLPTVILETGPSGARGVLPPSQCEIAVRRALLSDDNISAAVYADLVDTVRHEAEHGFQVFRAAQLEFLRTGDTAATIASRMNIPADVAEAAVEVQAGRRAGSALIAGSQAAQAAESYFRGLFTTAGWDARRAIMGELDQAADAYRSAERRWLTLEPQPPGPARLDARDALLEARTRWQEAHEAYRAIPEEAAAYRAGEAAAGAVRERLGYLGQLEAARQAERAAHGVLRPLEDLAVSIAGRPHQHLSYDTMLAYDLALTNWKRAFDAVFRLEQALARQARGLAP